MTRLLIFLIRVYQGTLGPVLGGCCRFYPTCSEYGIEALREHGALRGSWLTLRRLAKCHPLHAGGVDTVPCIVPSTDESALGRNRRSRP